MPHMLHAWMLDPAGRRNLWCFPCSQNNNYNTDTRTSSLKRAPWRKEFCGGGGKETKPPGNVLEGEKKEKNKRLSNEDLFVEQILQRKKNYQTFS